MHIRTTAGFVLGELDAQGPNVAHGETAWSLRHLAVQVADELLLDWLLPGVEYQLTPVEGVEAWEVYAAGWSVRGRHLLVSRAGVPAVEVYLLPRTGIGVTRVHELDRAHAYILEPVEAGGWLLVQL